MNCKKFIVVAFLWISTLVQVLHAINSHCKPRSYGDGKIVCVCSENYCDELDEIEMQPKGRYMEYTSSLSGLRLEKSMGTFTEVRSQDVNGYADVNAAIRLKVDPKGNKRTNAVPSQNMTQIPNEFKVLINRSIKKQKILGFGGAFTDSAGINIRELSPDLQKALISSYFGPNGIGYTTGRVPIGGSDFSPRAYTYDDIEDDANLTNFKLQPEDFDYKIPYLKMAQSLYPKLVLVGSPWTAPPWMKTNNDYWGRGLLREEYYQMWADYIVRFLRLYEDQDIKFWGITTQNEPLDGLIPFFPFNSMGWTSSRMRDWIKGNLGPTLKKQGFNDTKIMTLDENTVALPKWLDGVLSDEEAGSYVDGIAIHWYSNALTKYEPINSTHYKYPDKFILATEACAGFLPWELEKVSLGSWERGEAYAEDIIRDLQNWVIGWTDWNIALNPKGGPNWANLAADSPIIVNKTSGEFYKQPMFYAVAHVSKFFLPDSRVLSVDTKTKSYDSNGKESENLILAVAAERPDGSIAVVLLNKKDQNVNVSLWDELRGLSAVQMPPRSIKTILYR